MSEAEQTSQSPPESEQESVRMIGYSEPSLSPEDSQLVADVKQLRGQGKWLEAHQLLVDAGISHPDEAEPFMMISGRRPNSP